MGWVSFIAGSGLDAKERGGFWLWVGEEGSIDNCGMRYEAEGKGGIEIVVKFEGGDRSDGLIDEG